MIGKIRYNLTKNGKNAGAKMAVFVLEDLQGQVEVVLFPRKLNQFAELVAEDNVIFVRGNLDFRREKPNILASELITLEEAQNRIGGKVRISLDSLDVTEEKVMQIKTVCECHKGRSPVYVAVRTNKGKVFATADKSFCVHPDLDFCRKIRQVVGPGNFRLTQ
jgi:DNA polymerase-3 subunit alpha